MTPTKPSNPTFDDNDYQGDDPSSVPDREDDDVVVKEKDVCDVVGNSGKYAFTHLRGELFLFRGKARRAICSSLTSLNLSTFFPQKMWRFSDRAKLIRPGYPADFSLMFGDFGPNVTRIDAVYERPDDGRIVIFSGPQARIKRNCVLKGIITIS